MVCGSVSEVTRINESRHDRPRYSITAPLPPAVGPLVLQFVAQWHQPSSISLRVPVVNEMTIVPVRPTNAARVSNRTPILLSPACNLTHVGKHTVGVAAIHAIELLDVI